MNTKRILLGGLAAGLVMNVMDAVANGAVLGARYRACGEQGLLLKDPRTPFYVIWIVTILFLP